jgi:hypothetical protein
MVCTNLEEKGDVWVDMSELLKCVKMVCTNLEEKGNYYGGRTTKGK